MPNLKKYDNFDEFLQRNDIEVITFQDGIVARWKSTRTYKRGVQRVTETRTNQLIGADYHDLTKKLKKELKKLYHIPWIFMFGILMSAAFISLGIIESSILIIIFGLVLELSAIYYTIVNTIELINAKKILKSKTVITRDYLKTWFHGIGSLFYDVFSKIEEEESKIYKGDL
ncbi:hypothetical protein [Mariniplasma anaerobium]|uniref:hypothetical protein n=1 Tax=Mariniplasma anaerobium TaxID=2735436 RepID=UPI001E3EC65B|nr:hypothetical protein [Mariniplasma anaerobium]